ncbi:MAG TPA: hypothetical protein PKC39_12390 [Ferruginibacter sp.]|nr:hypothetical protein [Ferruginibacter sp.]HMP21749.1 hypothetical protein [Ferruginibacter sp.]
MKKNCTPLLLLLCKLGYAQPIAVQDIATDAIIPIPANLAKEPRFAVNLHSGYAVGLGSTFKFYPDDISSITITQAGGNTPEKTITYANPAKGLGDGLRVGFGGTYILNDFISLNLDFDYFRSTIRKHRDSSIHLTGQPMTNNAADEYYYSERNTISYQATIVSLTPAITFKAISKPKWFLYNKLGGIITFRPNSLQEDRTQSFTRLGWQGFYKDTSSTTAKHYAWGIRNPAFGFMGALGAQFKIVKNVRAFAEIQYSHIVFVIKKRTLTDFIINKENIVNSFTTSQREIEFVRSFSADNGTTANPDKPSQTIIQRIPISYIGLQAGISLLIP